MAANQSKKTVALNTDSATTWIVGLAGTWIILTATAEFDDTRELAVAFAVLVLFSAIMLHGPDALRNLGALGPQGYPSRVERVIPTEQQTRGGY